MLQVKRSPFNYTGNKYRLMDSLLGVFPTHGTVSTFYDCFWGGGTVAMNVPYSKIVGVEILTPLFDVHNFYIKGGFANADSRIQEIAKVYGLSCSCVDGTPGDKNVHNRDGFNKLRNDFNRTRDVELLCVLLIYSFNNNMRFNPKGDFNVPVGKRDYNKSIRRNLEEYISRLAAKQLTLLNADYSCVENILTVQDFVYLDPPYSITDAQYNANWGSGEDMRLCEFLDRLSKKGIRFCMSNVLAANGRDNDFLRAWSAKYNVYSFDMDYDNSSYNKTAKHVAEEVCITNYKI